MVHGAYVCVRLLWGVYAGLGWGMKQYCTVHMHAELHTLHMGRGQLLMRNHPPFHRFASATCMQVACAHMCMQKQAAIACSSTADHLRMRQAGTKCSASC